MPAGSVAAATTTAGAASKSARLTATDSAVALRPAATAAGWAGRLTVAAGAEPEPSWLPDPPGGDPAPSPSVQAASSTATAAIPARSVAGRRLISQEYGNFSGAPRCRPTPRRRRGIERAP